MAVVAYIDPGSGLLAWQAVVAVFFGVLFYLKKTRTWLVRQIRRLFRLNKPTEPEPVTTELECHGDEKKR
jgi:hypothetical protein